MFGGADRRKTINHTAGRQSTARTPTKARFTDVASSSARKSIHTGSRTSISRPSDARLSLFRGSATQQKDVKANAPANVSKIYRFLVEHESEPPPEKLIRSPNGRQDFSCIFELIYQHLSKDFEVEKNCPKIEDEIIPIFEGLGYPQKLKKSYFQPISSPHNYPHLLEAMAWLVEVVQTSHKIAQSTQYVLTGDFNDAKSAQKPLMYSWLGILYRDFTTDRYKLEDTKYVEDKTRALREHMAREDDTEEEVESAKAILEQLNFECAEMEADKGVEHTYKDELNRLSDDMRKAKEYTLLCSAKMKTAEEEYQKSSELLTKKREESQELKNEIETMKSKIQQQKQIHGLSGEDVRKMNTEMRKNRDLINEKRNQLEKLSHCVYLISEKNRESFTEQKENFAKLLRLVDELSSGVDLTIESFKMPLTEEELGAEIDRMINEFVPTFSQRLNEKGLELNEQESRIAQKLESVRENLEIDKEKLEELKKLEGREERIRRKERDEWKEQRLALEKKVEELENEKELIIEQQKAVQQLDQDIEIERENLRKKQELCQKQCQMIDDEVREKVVIMANELTNLENERLGLLKFADEVSKTAKVLKRKN